MELIVRPRKGGKTTEMIRRAAETGAYICCPNSREAHYVAARARELGLNIRFPLTPDELRSCHGHRHPIMFDNADQILQYLAGSSEVLAATWTVNEPDDR